MKNVFFFLLLFCLQSCIQNCKPYYENGKECALLYSCDKKYKIASILVYDYSDIFYDKNKALKRVENLSKFYNIEGYRIFIYSHDKGDDISEIREECISKGRLSDREYVPYEYIKHYIVENDTILYGLDRFKGCAHLFTKKKFTSKDSTFLLKAFESMGLYQAFLFHDKEKYENLSEIDKDMNSYIKFFRRGSNYDLFFLDETYNGDYFNIGGIYVSKREEKELTMKYTTSDYLNKEQMLQIFKQNKSKEKLYEISFYTNKYGTKDYGAISKHKNEFVVYLFYNHTTWTYHRKTEEWKLIKNGNKPIEF